MDNPSAAVVAEVSLPELTFPDARGGRKPQAPLAIEVVRGLTPADLAALGSAVAATPQRLLQVRAHHHNLARLVAEGREGVEMSLITGYSPSYISTLQNDPAFAELVCYYSTQREMVFVDTLERLRSLGIASAEELQRRLEESPEKFSNREVMELVEMALLKPEAIKATAKAGSGPQAAVNVTVSFVKPQDPDMLDITPGRAA